MTNSTHPPGPRQPPRMHGDGCICGDSPRANCPAKARHKTENNPSHLTDAERISDERLDELLKWASKIEWTGDIANALRELKALRSRLPDGHAYRYANGFIRHNGGLRVNGSDPIESIPYYYGVPNRLPGS